MLGDFGLALFGKVAAVRTDLDDHEAVQTSGVHGSTSAATASKLMHRDANGRAHVVSPAASDNSTLIATTAWVQGELTGVGSGTVTSVGTGTGLSGGPVTTTGTISLANTTVTPGSYTFASITVDAQGRITLASNGAAVTSVGATAPVTSTGGATPTIGMPPATASVNGYMTSTFAAKLNGIASGAEVNAVDSVFGRTGAVVAVANDYNITQIDGITITTGAPTGGASGDIHFRYTV